jgi:hypothetical protein
MCNTSMKRYELALPTCKIDQFHRFFLTSTASIPQQKANVSEHVHKLSFGYLQRNLDFMFQVRGYAIFRARLHIFTSDSTTSV